MQNVNATIKVKEVNGNINISSAMHMDHDT